MGNILEKVKINKDGKFEFNSIQFLIMDGLFFPPCKKLRKSKNVSSSPISLAVQTKNPVDLAFFYLNQNTNRNI